MKQLLSIVGLCLFLMVGMSWEVGAFSESDLKKLKVTGNCIKCDLSGVDLWGNDLNGANLPRADLTDANLTEAFVKGAIIEEAKFCRTQTPWGEDNSGC